MSLGHDRNFGMDIFPDREPEKSEGIVNTYPLASDGNDTAKLRTQLKRNALFVPCLYRHKQDKAACLAVENVAVFNMRFSLAYREKAAVDDPYLNGEVFVFCDRIVFQRKFRRYILFCYVSCHEHHYGYHKHGDKKHERKVPQVHNVKNGAYDYNDRKKYFYQKHSSP